MCVCPQRNSLTSSPFNLHFISFVLVFIFRLELVVCCAILHTLEIDALDNGVESSAGTRYLAFTLFFLVSFHTNWISLLFCFRLPTRCPQSKPESYRNWIPNDSNKTKKEVQNTKKIQLPSFVSTELELWYTMTFYSRQNWQCCDENMVDMIKNIRSLNKTWMNWVELFTTNRGRCKCRLE